MRGGDDLHFIWRAGDAVVVAGASNAPSDSEHTGWVVWSRGVSM